MNNIAVFSFGQKFGGFGPSFHFERSLSPKLLKISDKSIFSSILIFYWIHLFLFNSIDRRVNSDLNERSPLYVNELI